MRVKITFNQSTWSVLPNCIFLREIVMFVLNLLLQRSKLTRKIINFKFVVILTGNSNGIFCASKQMQKVWENEGLQIENMAKHFVIYELRHFGRCLLAILVLE